MCQKCERNFRTNKILFEYSITSNAIISNERGVV